MAQWRRWITCIPNYLAAQNFVEYFSNTHVVVMTNGNSNALSELRAITAEALAALDTGHQISPFSARLSAFDLDDAYRVAAAIRQMREARGEMPVGRKIGFTNRTIWAEYNVYGPIWGYVYNRTVHNLEPVASGRRKRSRRLKSLLP